MRFPAKRLLALLLVIGLATPMTVFATNGYFLIGYGAKSRAMGGVGIALAQDGMASAVNPAGLADLKLSVDGDLMIFHAKRKASCCVAPEGVVSGANLYAVPSMGAAYKFNRRLVFGMAGVGAGLGTRYNQNLFIDDPALPGSQPKQTGDQSTLGVALFQMQMLPGASYKINSHHAVGASLAIGVQMFRAYGLEVFEQFSQNPDKVTNNGNDWSYGAGVRLGWRGKFFKKKLTLGATWASKVYMKEFDKYRGLFAEQGDFDIPENFGIGIALKPNKKLILAADITRILYSDINSVGNPSTPISRQIAGSPDQNDPNALGHARGPGFDWKDMTIYKFGGSYKWNKRWTYRLGYNYGASPVKENDSIEFNVLAPGIVEQHFTMGFTYFLSRNQQLSFAYVHAKRNKQTATIDTSSNLPFTGEVEIELVENTAELMFSYSF